MSHVGNERQQRVNNIWYCESANKHAVQYWSYMMDVLASIVGKKKRHTLLAISWSWVSTERQRFLVLLVW